MEDEPRNPPQHFPTSCFLLPYDGEVYGHGSAPRCSLTAAIVACALALPAGLAAAELQAKTLEAYTAYVEQARRTFLARVESRRIELPPAGVTVVAGPGRDDGITSVPGGLVHHWTARAFVRDVDFARALQAAQEFGAYPRIYKAVQRADVISRDGDTFRVRMRLRESEAGITAVFQVTTTIRYVRAGRSAHAFSHADEIREVERPGAGDERLLPVGQGSGYLWAADTFTRFVEHDGGVYLETETLGLSRGFPALLGWFIEPIARRLGRRSAEATMHEFVEELRRRGRG